MGASQQQALQWLVGIAVLTPPAWSSESDLVSPRQTEDIHSNLTSVLGGWSPCIFEAGYDCTTEGSFGRITRETCVCAVVNSPLL